jgi:hypothetical protein
MAEEALYPASAANVGSIKVRVRDINQLFNSMDPSPFRDKDLDRDAEEFIVVWAKELPTDAKLELVIHVDDNTLGRDQAHLLEAPVSRFFRYRSRQSTLKVRQLLRIGRTSLFIGLFFLAACIIGGNYGARLFHNSTAADLLRESLLIGGWVAMWRPLEIFLYDWWPLRRERELYDRLSQMPVRIETALPDPAATPGR